MQNRQSLTNSESLLDLRYRAAIGVIEASDWQPSADEIVKFVDRFLLSQPREELLRSLRPLPADLPLDRITPYEKGLGGFTGKMPEPVVKNSDVLE